MIHPRRAKGGLLGVAVGDALSVRARAGPSGGSFPDSIEGGLPFGHPGRRPAAWSDRTSLTFCTVEALTGDYSLARLGELFTRWLQEAHWSSGSEAPETDKTTQKAIERIARGVPPEHSGVDGPDDDGSCSLVRTLPIAIAFSRWSIPLMIEKVHEAARMTHAQTRCLMACGLFGLTIRNLAYNRSISVAYRSAMEDGRAIYDREPWRSERRPFRRMMRGSLGEVSPDQIDPGGSIVRKLEAALWCLQTTQSFRDCLEQALKLDEGSGVVAPAAAALAGVAHGVEAIPGEWLDLLDRRDDLNRASERFAAIVSA
jgi:ADP-ribosyl-[dinitrogen reductase] hydrolase